LVATDTYYEVLGLSEGASQDEVRAAYLRLVKINHPDQGGSGVLFRLVQEAYTTLSDPVRRAAYDRKLHGPGPQVRPHGASAPPPPPPTPEHGRATRFYRCPEQPGPRAGFVASYPETAVSLAGGTVLALGTTARALFFVGAIILGTGLCAVAGRAWLVHRGSPGKRQWRTYRAHPGALDLISGTDFELLLVELFRRAGYQVTHTGKRGDFGADIVIEAEGAKTVVQAKRYTAVVRHAAVQEAVAAKAMYKATGAMVVTTAGFSPHAAKLARANNVELWDRPRLVAELGRYGLGAQPLRSVSTTGVKLFAKELLVGIPVVAATVGLVLVALLALVADSGAKGTKKRRRRSF
jgi:curved DNA-binding protein CbpA